MAGRYDLAELFRHPDEPLTDDQFENWPKYMAMANDDKSAADVEITDAVETRIREIDKKGTYWF